MRFTTSGEGGSVLDYEETAQIGYREQEQKSWIKAELGGIWTDEMKEAAVFSSIGCIC